MATSYSIRAELRDIRKAIRDLINGAQSATISSNGGTRSYTRTSLKELQDRETVLYSRISRSNVRKRTAPDFS